MTFPLNSTGRSWISKTGSTKLGLREGHDVINSSSGITAGVYNALYTYTSEQSGTTRDPHLDVTYSTAATTATTYTYDAGDNRVTKGGSSTTIYPSPGYRVEGTTSTVYLGGPNGDALAEIANTGTTSTISTISTDHLGSTALTTNSSGTVNQLLDYHGFGNTRISSGTTSEKKTFIGQYSDTETSLSYLNARYYDAGRGQFLSEDPMFWGSLSPRSLLNPQRLNSYSYARDNPIKRKDPSGLYDINTGLIQKGDTLSAIASQINKAWGTTYTTSSLAAQNGISNVNLIYAGNYIYYTMPGVVGGSCSSQSSASTTSSSSSATSSMGGSVAAATGLSALGAGSIQTTIDAAVNDLGRYDHIFGKSGGEIAHGFSDIIDYYNGSREAAMEAIARAGAEGANYSEQGYQSFAASVGGETVTIQGTMLENGVFRLGTAAVNTADEINLQAAEDSAMGASILWRLAIIISAIVD